MSQSVTFNTLTFRGPWVLLRQPPHRVTGIDKAVPTESISATEQA